MQIIYEPHPVTPERKAELRRQGYTILDAKFAPEGYEHPDDKPKRKPRQTTQQGADDGDY